MTEQSKELCKLVIQQAFVNLEDYVHFIEGDSQELQDLTRSQLVKKAFMLVMDPNYQTLLSSVKIMTQISRFFCELSEDNSFIGEATTEEIKAFILNLRNVVNAENSEFVLNMTSFYLSGLDESQFLAQVDVIAELVEKQGQLTQMRSPQSLFAEHFGSKFKKVEDSKGEDDEEVMKDDEVEMEEVITDKSVQAVVMSQEFKQWQTVSHGHAALLKMYERVLAIVGGEDDSDYEDMDSQDEVEVVES